VDDTLDELKDTNFYNHLGLTFGFRHVRVCDLEIHKSAFQTIDDLMERVAMMFGLCNAPTPFQRMMNDMLRDFFFKFYLDDVYLQSHTRGTHGAPTSFSPTLQGGLEVAP
jgi:hypothetical protein